jgi:hypothetical protein
MELTRDELYRRYVEEEKTTRDIAEEFKLSQWKVLELLKEYDIPLRARGGARNGRSVRRRCAH